MWPPLVSTMSTITLGTGFLHRGKFGVLKDGGPLWIQIKKAPLSGGAFKAASGPGNATGLGVICRFAVTGDIEAFAFLFFRSRADQSADQPACRPGRTPARTKRPWSAPLGLDHRLGRRWNTVPPTSCWQHNQKRPGRPEMATRTHPSATRREYRRRRARRTRRANRRNRACA